MHYVKNKPDFREIEYLHRSNGNYEAFARPKKTTSKSADQKSAYLVDQDLHPYQPLLFN